MSTGSSDPLARVRRATMARDRADAEYRAAMVAARQAGCSFGQIARAAGVSRQTARVNIERAKEGM